MHPFKFVIVYENVAAAVNAKEVARRLGSQFAGEFAADIEFWKLKVLDHPQMRASAAKDMAGADMIIIATDGQPDLPDAVKTWLWDCLAQKRNGWAALVALFAKDELAAAAPPPLCRSLQEMAARGRLDFFSNVPVHRQHGFERVAPAGDLHSFNHRPGLEAGKDWEPAAGWDARDIIE
jgi:hypothetical protein